MRKTMIWVLLAAPLVGFVITTTGMPYRLFMGIGLPRWAAAVVADPALRGQALYRAGAWREAADAFAIAGPRAGYDLGNALAHSGRLGDALRVYDRALDSNPEDEDAAFNRTLVARVMREAADRRGEATRPERASAAAVRERQGLGGKEKKGEAPPSAGSGIASGQNAVTQANTPGGSKATKRAASDKPSSESAAGQSMGSPADAEGEGQRGSANEAIPEQQTAQRRRIDRSWESQSVQPTRHWLETIPDDEGKYLKLRLAAEHAQRQKSSRENVGDHD